MIYLGIDPSQRHTGLCVINGSAPTFEEIKTDERDVMSSVASLRRGLSNFLMKHLADPGNKAGIGVEKQVLSGQSSTLLFYVQMAVMETLADYRGYFTMIHPLPIQLKSYIRKTYGIDPKQKSSIVNGFKEQNNYQYRISSHCAEAFYLAKMAQDVLEGKCGYTPPSREVPLVPWEIIHKVPRTAV